MFSTLRTRFGIPGVISVIALVFAMLGGAYAANNSGFAGKATASAKAKKGPRGPKGAAGPAGPAGPQGPAGPKGDTGTAGSNGSDGAPGAPGTDGKSAEATSFAGNQHGCSEGGVEVKSAKPTTFVCNGVKGTNGTTGFTERLPAGKTETGTWSISANATEKDQTFYSPISFAIPVEEPVGGGAYHWLDRTETQTEAGTGGCTGTVASPTAPAGVLCIYTNFEDRTAFAPSAIVTLEGSAGANTWAEAGAVIEAHLEGEPGEPQRFRAYGSYAITAATP